MPVTVDGVWLMACDTRLIAWSQAHEMEAMSHKPQAICDKPIGWC